jgi:hypothetical protein
MNTKPNPMVVGTLGSFFLSFRRRHTHHVMRSDLRDSIRVIRMHAGRDSRASALADLRNRGSGLFA